MKKSFKKISKSLATATLMALVLSTFGIAITQSAAPAQAAEGTATVTILKYIDGAPATATNASSSDFQMNATWTINGATGTGQYALSASGYNGDPTPYQAITSALPLGSDYGTSEIVDGTVVGATIATTSPFSLVGYTTGATLAEATAATPTLTVPNFTSIANNEFVIVWNHDNNAVVTPPVVATSTPVVTNTATGITSTDATLNGTDGSEDASGHSFWVSTSTFSTASPTLPTGVYSTTDLGPVASSTAFSALLSSASGLPAVTASTTYYFVAWANVGGTWTPGTINTFMTSSSTSNGTIDGTVTGGATSSIGVFAVTGVTAVKTTSVADGTFASGLEYTFNITVPTDETHLSMKFADWMSTVGSNILPVANNMRISSAQADNAGATVLVTASDTYTSPKLHMTGDLNPALAGNQVQIKVEVAVPNSTINGSYSTSYGVQTQ